MDSNYSSNAKILTQQRELQNYLDKITNKYILEIIFDNLSIKKRLEIIKYNKLL